MILASIDIGSNAVRLLFANAYEHEGHSLVEKATLIRIPVRLGMDVFRDKKIGKEKIKHLIKTLKAFKLLIDVYQPVRYCAYATAAMREAKNQEYVIKKIKEKTGIKVEIIDGIEEANIIKELNNTIIDEKQRIKMYIDVGGGSTDISFLENNKIKSSKSFNIGTVRMLENMTEETEWIRLKEWLYGFRQDYGKIFCIGTGGNINKIGKMYANPMDNILSYDKLLESYNYFNSYSLDDRINRLGLRPDRADVIIPALKIYLTIMEHSKIKSIYIPRIGLADGLIYKMYREIKK
jgi:exopolyphosphatase / guanosine-5'-triphosphate,3'-diphosphate pyrophosphatase